MHPGFWQRASTREVATWQKEEESATMILQQRQREQADNFERKRAQRAADPGAIKNWLILVPIPIGDSPIDGAAALATEQISGEAQLEPRAGRREHVGELSLLWRETRLDDYLIDFLDLLGGVVNEWHVGYAVCYVESQTAQQGLSLKVGADDWAKIYLNGREIYRREMHSPYVADTDVVSGVNLKPGRNVLVFKVVYAFGNWLGSARFTDSTGNPVKGIRVTLDPGEEESPDHQRFAILTLIKSARKVIYGHAF